MEKLYTIEFNIPYKVSTNKFYSSRHWGFRKWVKNKWFEYLSFNILHIAKLKPVPKNKYPLVFVYHFYFAKRCLDSSNCSIMAKMIEDSLVDCRIIENDDQNFVKGNILLVHKSDNQRDFVVLEIYGKYRELEENMIKI